MEFEWDPKKAVANSQKHGVNFQEASTVFGNLLSITYNDPDYSLDEQRYLTFGASNLGRLLVVSHTDRENRVRIISARRMTPQERMIYEKS